MPKEQLTVGKLRGMLGGLGNDVKVVRLGVDTSENGYSGEVEVPAFTVQVLVDDSTGKSIKRVVIS